MIQALTMMEDAGFPFDTADEDEITDALHAILESNLRHSGVVPGFNKRSFEAVTRHGPVLNHDFTKTKTAPDLCFRLRKDDEPPAAVRSVHDALFVECKPVDRSHPSGEDYCDNGLARFVTGDYAWAMQDVLMIAYARHGRTLDTHLVPAMKKRGKDLRIIIMPCLVPGAPARGRAESLRVSRHGRGFRWPDGKGAAVDVFVYHTWHRCGG